MPIIFAVIVVVVIERAVPVGLVPDRQEIEMPWA
jgi:hypothetical protein